MRLYGAIAQKAVIFDQKYIWKVLINTLWSGLFIAVGVILHNVS
jgi:hypothetical protein